MIRSILISLPLYNKRKDRNNNRKSASEKRLHNLETFFVKGKPEQKAQRRLIGTLFRREPWEQDGPKNANRQQLESEQVNPSKTGIPPRKSRQILNIR